MKYKDRESPRFFVGVPGELVRSLADMVPGSCNVLDMATYLSALPTGEHCPRELIGLGMRACAAEEERRADLPKNAGQSRAKFGFCPNEPAGADCLPRVGDCKD